MEPNDIVNDVCRYYTNDQCDVSPALKAIIDGYRRSGNVAGLASCSLHFDWHSHSVGDWRFLRQIEAFYKKNANLAVAEVCRDAAHSSFVKSETQCSETNIRLHDYIRGKRCEAPYAEFVRRMQRYIYNVLGEFRPFLNDLPRLVKVTPGATATTNRVKSLPQLKMRMRLYATHRATPYISGIYHLLGFRSPRFKEIRSNRVELVPKNWKTDRTIACEPEGNIPLQLAFDTYVKRRLRLFGINLSDQSANQKAAKHASIHNDLVTVDFASASDTVSFNTVSWLLPPEWFKFLYDVRSSFYRGQFGEGVYAKFSSMGNGSTFTLETLIFAAACYAVGSKRFLVYGDDVILEKELFSDYITLTRFLGFSINTEKSFSDGPFRESCGKDWFNGTDVTPVYIRSVDLRKANLSHLVNTLASLAVADGKLEAFLLRLVRDFKLPFVPFNDSTLSGVWIDPLSARRQGILRHSMFCGVGPVDTFRAFTPKCEKRYFVDSRGYYLWFLYKNSQVLFSGPWAMSGIRQVVDQTQTSSVPVFLHTYVRKRVHWWKPVMAEPIHLQWWSDKLLTRDNSPVTGLRG